MAGRGIAFVLAGLLLGGCMHTQLEPASDANLTPRDKKLLANAPYAKANIPTAYQRTSSNITARKRRARSWSIATRAISITCCPTTRRSATA